MNNSNDLVYFYKWVNNSPIEADVFQIVVFDNGGQTYGKIGKASIIEGDVVSLNYGSNHQVYTRSGKGYESEYPHGRITLIGSPVSVELTPETSKFIKKESLPKQEFDLLVEKQTIRMSTQIDSLIKEYVKKEQEKREHMNISKELAETKRKEMIQNALKQMDDFFNNNQRNTSSKSNKPK